MKIKPYAVFVVKEDEVDCTGIPTEQIESTWTRASADELCSAISGELLKTKTANWAIVLERGWKLWWTLNCASVYRLVSLQPMTMKKIWWFYWERLPSALLIWPWKRLWRMRPKFWNAVKISGGCDDSQKLGFRIFARRMRDY